MDSNILQATPDISGLPRGSVGRIFYDHLKKFGNKICLIDGLNGDKLTFAEVLETSVRLANALKKKGLKKNEFIGLISENQINYFVPYLACLYNGYILNILSPDYTKFELVKYLSQTETKTVFCSAKVLPKLLQVKAEYPHIEEFIILDTEEELSLKELVKTGDGDVEAFRPEVLDEEQVGMLLYSSGTTGLPKAVMLTHKNLRQSILQTGENYVCAKPTDIFLYNLPCFHIICCIPIGSTFIHGATMVLLSKFKPEVYLNAIQKYQPNKMILVPQLVLFLIKHHLVEKYDLSSITDIFCGAAPITLETIKQITKKLPNCTFHNMYGMTESAGGLAINSMRDGVLASVGKLVSNNVAKVVDENGKILGANQIGELCFKGDSISIGYYKNQEASRASRDKEGFLKTGDIGYYNEDGYIFVVDRVKDIIKNKSFQVSPSEIESILLLHQGVQEAGVIGIYHEIAGELPFAFVVRKPEADVTAQELFDFVAEFLSEHKHLRGGLEFVESLPKTAVGKLDRKTLKSMWKQDDINRNK